MDGYYQEIDVIENWGSTVCILHTRETVGLKI